MKTEVKDMHEGDSALLLRIRASLGEMSAAETRIAENILAHPRDIVHLSITELAERSQVSDASVVRFCRKRLGMQGYQELKVALAQDLVSPIESIHEEVGEEDSEADVLAKVFSSTMHTLEYTMRIIDKRQFKLAVDAIHAARVIHIYGCGNSAAIAMDMQHKLMRLGLCASAFSDSHMQCIAGTALEAGDVCIAISHSGSSKDVVEAAFLAKKRGAKIICMTGIGRSPLGDMADIRLDTASKETSYHIVALSSRISQYTIIDSLYSALAVKRHQQEGDARQNIIEQALSKKKY
ncbi:MAG: MurR/RpiR family transcriptional regulator [Clostridia bacterium]|nr:MurR/RpiR family transcriptional regulator [Clostridia bacterium]